VRRGFEHLNGDVTLASGLSDVKMYAVGMPNYAVPFFFG